MKPMVLLLLALVAETYAQQPATKQPQSLAANSAELVEHNVIPTPTDLYCAGFVAKQLPAEGRFVAAGVETPLQVRYSTRDLIFLRGGGYTPGTRVGIIREVRDPNRFIPFPAAQNLLERTGHLYDDIGYAVVLENRGVDTAVAQIEFTCDNVMPGDQIVPFETRSPVEVRPRSSMDRFPAHPPRLNGSIVAAQDFVQYVSSGQKIYLNLGDKKGIRPGDYLRVVRDYDPKSLDVTDAQVFRQTLNDDMQIPAGHLHKSQLHELPRRVVGEAVVLRTQPEAATAMVTFAMEDIHIGDKVEVEEREEAP